MEVVDQSKASNSSDWVWIGNADYDQVAGQFADQGITWGCSGPKDRQDITRDDLRGIAKVRAHFGAGAVYDVLSDRSSEEMFRRGMVAVYRLREDLGFNM